MEIETLLHKEIAANLKLMENMARDSEEYKQVAKNTTDLMDRAIDMEKIHADTAAKDASRELERELKFKQLDDEHELKLKQLEDQEYARIADHELKLQQAGEERKGRIWRDVISIAGIVVPTWLAVWGTKASFKFEQEGTITTSAGRNFIGKLFRGGK